MEVVCSRCQAEYEFDDALIAARGTAVRCTSCGLQFKVFLQTVDAPRDLWRVRDPFSPSSLPLEFESVSSLQQAIISGEISAAHLLSRGSEPPRALSELVEFQPLLQQSKPRQNIRTNRKEAEAQPKEEEEILPVSEIEEEIVPASDFGEEMVPAASTPEEGPLSADDNVIVPSFPPEAIGEGVGAPREQLLGGLPSGGHRLKIHSALSSAINHEATHSQKKGDSPPDTGSVLPSRGSLRDSLRSSRAPARGVQARTVAEGKAPSSHPRRATPAENFSGAGPTSSPERAAQEHEASEATSSHDTEGREEASQPEEETLRRQLTPTPLGIRSYTTADSLPVSTLPGLPTRRGARSAGIVLAVLGGGAAFLLFANRNRLFELVEPRDQIQEEAEISSALSQDLRERLDIFEISWVRSRLLHASAAGAGYESDIGQSLVVELDQAGHRDSWQMVDLLRALSKSGEARRLASRLSSTVGSFYSLALLDLSEGAAEPPWPVVHERLREAASGERGLFLARAVYIYSLFESGQSARASADFDALSQLQGAVDAPLYPDLRDYLQSRLEKEETKVEQEEEPEREEFSPAGALQVRTEGKVEAKAEVKAEAEAEVKVETKTEVKKVAPAVFARMEQADNLWRVGQRDDALSLYRKIVGEIGTAHFLGQRAAARIRQAEREKAGNQ